MRNVLSASLRAMESARANWSDGRLDDLSSRVSELDHRLSDRIGKLEVRMDARFNEVETRMDARFNEVDSTLHSIQRSMIVTLAGILAAFGGLLAAIRF
jgi:enoyl-[acyl-carrier-protein] reductase (NADH)